MKFNVGFQQYTHMYIAIIWCVVLQKKMLETSEAKKINCQELSK